MDYKIYHRRGSIMFTVTERSDSPEMDLMMPLAPSAHYWKKTLICSSECMGPTQHSSEIFMKEARAISPPQSYDLGGHMVTASLKVSPVL